MPNTTDKPQPYRRAIGRNPNNDGFGSPGIVPFPFAPAEAGHNSAFGDPVVQVDYRVLGQASSLSQGAMLLAQAETDYLNGLYQQCSAAFSWLECLSRGYVDDPAPILTNYPHLDLAFTGAIPQIGVVPPSQTEWLALRDRTLALLAQISVGLDFYGYPKNYAPTVDQNVYQSLLEQLHPIAKDVEDLHGIYVTKLDDVQARKNALSAIIAKAQTLNQASAIEIHGLEDQATAALSEANNLTDVFENQKNFLQQAEDEFVTSVQATSECDVLSTLIFVGSVIAVAAGQYEAIAGVVEGAEGSVSNAKKIQGAVQLVKIVGHTLDDFKAAYNTFKGPLNSSSPDVKLIIDQEDYDKLIANFTQKLDGYSTPQAQHYKELGIAHIRTAQSRNGRLVDFTQYMLKKSRLEAEVAQREQETQRVEMNLAALQDPALVECEVFVRALLAQTKNNLLRSVYMFRKAAEYASLSQLPLTINPNTVEEIYVSYGLLLSARQQSLEMRNSDATYDLDLSLIDPGPNPDLPSTVQGISLHEAFANFRLKKPLVFSIPADHPAFRRGWADVRIRKISVTIDGVETDDGIVSIKLIHCGNSQFVNPNQRLDPYNRLIEYSHQTRSFVITTGGNAASSELGLQDVSGTEKQYAYLSPFAVWRIEVSDSANANPRLDRLDEDGNPLVREVKLSFEIVYTAFT